MKRLKCPPAIAQFMEPLDKNDTNEVIKILLKYSPETKKEKKERLQKEAQNEVQGKKQKKKKLKKKRKNQHKLRCITLLNLHLVYIWYGLELIY